MQVSRSTGVPLYRQIQEYIREKIESGEWTVGQQIPTEQVLCEQFQVSRITVVKALNRLVGEGVIRKEQGRGTFVTSSPLMPEPITLRSFSEEMRSRGLQPGTVVLRKAIETPNARLRDRLQLAQGEQVWRITRLLKADETPVGIQHACLPCERFPDLGVRIHDDSSLYAVLSEVYAVQLHSAIETYSSVQLDKEESELLALPSGSPAFAVDRLTFTGDKPIEFVKSMMRSDYFQYTVRLVRTVQH